MNIGIDLEREYQENLIRQFARKASFEVRFVEKEAALRQEDLHFIFCTEDSSLRNLDVSTLVFVDRKECGQDQVSRLQAFSRVYVQIVEWLDQRRDHALDQVCPKVTVCWPGNRRLQTAVCLGLASMLSRQGKKILYLPTAGLDINDLLLDSPLDDGFSKLFLSNSQQAVSCFSYHHLHQFYYLSSTKHGKDKLQVDLARWKQVLELLTSLSLFDLIVWEAGCDLRDEELFLLSQTQTVVFVESQDAYAQMMLTALRQRAFLQRPDHQEWINVQEEALELSKVSPYQKTLSGFSFDPDQSFSCTLHHLSRQLLERMMNLG